MNSNSANGKTSEDLFVEKVLKERATKFKKLETIEEYSGDVIEGLEFRLGSERYLIDSAYVREVLPLKEITPLPATPDFLLGVINVRGVILAVISVKSFLKIPKNESNVQNKIVIVNYKDVELGMLVDEIIGISKVYTTELQITKGSDSGNENKLIMGLTTQRLIVLNIKQLLQSDQIVINDKI